MNDSEFEKLVAAGVDAIPKRFTDKLNNVAIVIADTPNSDQAKQARLRPGFNLFGLYEGIPQTKRGSGYTMVLPDKITIFKLPILAAAGSAEEVKAIVKNTVWHEIAHHFGLDEREVRAREARHQG